MSDGHIFLSYRSIEADFALKLAADLKNAGVNLWMDRLDAGIKVGDDWVQALQDALDNCFAVVAVLSPDYVESKYCRRELKRADGLGRAIYPVLLRKLEKNQWPFEIQEKQYIDFREGRDDKIYRTQFDELIKVLQAKFPAQFSEAPDTETQYLTTLIAELESRKGVLEYVELSTQADAPKTAEATRPEPTREDEWAAGFSLLIEKKSDTVGTGFFPSVSDTPTEKLTFNSIAEAVAKFPRFVLIGEPGAGKTTTIRRLALEAARQRLEHPRTAPLPLLLYLPRWGDEPTPLDFIRRHWPFANDPAGLLANGDVLLYLDGLNEMGATGVEKAKKLTEWFAEKDTPRRVIVTCRAGDYAGELKLGDTPTVLAEEMDEKQIREFAERYLGKKSAGFLGRVMPEDKRAQEDARSLFRLAKNPYLLAALLFVYDNAPDGDLPRNNGALMRALARALWERERQKQTAGWIPFREMEEKFGKLAFAMINEAKPIDVPTEFALLHIEDEYLLRAGHSANLIEIHDVDVRFYHELMQEYFSAIELRQLGISDKFIDDAWRNALISLNGLFNEGEDIDTVAEEFSIELEEQHKLASKRDVKDRYWFIKFLGNNRIVAGIPLLRLYLNDAIIHESEYRVERTDPSVEVFPRRLDIDATLALIKIGTPKALMIAIKWLTEKLNDNTPIEIYKDIDLHRPKMYEDSTYTKRLCEISAELLIRSNESSAISAVSKWIEGKLITEDNVYLWDRRFASDSNRSIDSIIDEVHQICELINAGKYPLGYPNWIMVYSLYSYTIIYDAENSAKALAAVEQWRAQQTDKGGG